MILICFLKKHMDNIVMLPEEVSVSIIEMVNIIMFPEEAHVFVTDKIRNFLQIMFAPKKNGVEISDCD